MSADVPYSVNGVEPEQNLPLVDESKPEVEAEPESQPRTESNPEPPESESISSESELKQTELMSSEPRLKQSEPISFESELKQSELEPEQLENGADPKLDGSNETSIRSHDEVQQSPSPTQEVSQPELRQNEGSATFTMRELLNGLNHDQSTEVSSPYSEESPHPVHSEQSNAALELINSVAITDEEGRSRQRVLTFAARRYAVAVERNPEDYDSLYNWALVLQESADNVSPDSTSPSKDALLEEACKKYDEATRLCPTIHDAFYNWAIAISDRAKMRGRTKEAEELWKQATKNYEKAIQLNWNSPQALNNWGLALQELSAIVPAREKQTIVRSAISKFRAAIRLQFDFHRAIYNLGTVLYGLAEDTLRAGGSGSPKDVTPNELYSQSAIYIAAAHALKPNYSVYSSALRLVRSMLPLPQFKVGYLTAPPVGKQVAPHSDWKRSQFILNHEGLHQVVNKGDQKHLQSLSGNSGDALKIDKKAIRVYVSDIVSVSPCADLTLPPGAGLCIDTIQGSVYMVADSWESLDGWLDAIRLVYTIYARGKSDVLAGIITA